MNASFENAAPKAEGLRNVTNSREAMFTLSDALNETLVKFLAAHGIEEAQAVDLLGAIRYAEILGSGGCDNLPGWHDIEISSMIVQLAQGLAVLTQALDKLEENHE